MTKKFNEMKDDIRMVEYVTYQHNIICRIYIYEIQIQFSSSVYVEAKLEINHR